MATKFFTNNQENTLLKKFEGIFTHTKVSHFDVLVAFFRASGYFLIQPYLKQVKNIRILVGIDVDHLISEAAKKGLEFKFNANETREEFLAELQADIQQADYKKAVEEGMIEFIKRVVDGSIEIKAHPNKNIHAKIYIFRPENFNEHNGGSVITGSSNLSISGIENNFEFNVELRDYDDVAFATTTFESLWSEGIDIVSGEIEKIKNRTYLNESFTPFEIYIKFLIEYFGQSIEYDPESIEDLPKGYTKLRYQVDAVNDGYQKLMQHNGFILADVVGLGKTIVSTIIAKKFFWSNGPRTRILVVIPPPLKDSWQKTVDDFDVPGIEFITNGSLHKVIRPERYDLIIVDEAHKFRSDTSEMFNLLQKICKTPRKNASPTGDTQKKVVLITATPLNNTPDDIRNQLYLFQDAKKSSLEVGNLQGFFRPLIDDFRKLKKVKDQDKVTKDVKRIYSEIREKIIKPIVVRRTRTDIMDTEEYRIDLKDQGIIFPDIVPPKQILYELDEQLDALYDESFNLIKDTRKGLRYYRYQAIRFLSPELKKQYKQADMISDQLAKIIKTMLVKRIDSSFYAFKMSLNRYQQANLAMIKMFENDRIFIAPDLKVNEFILEDREDELIELMENAEDPDRIRQYSTDDFDEELYEGLRSDQAILNDLTKRWNDIEDDPKFDEFYKRINTELFDKTINPEQKLVVFSESKETTNYLKKRLQEKGLDRVLAIESANVSDYSKTIAQNFDANYSLADQLNDIDIIITTEVLAEGVNLHRSNNIVNYDIPWNATKLMQRIGRVNRIGSKSDKVFIYNFFPTSKADSEIELNKKAYMKLQGFHSALGEDSQIYSQEEEFETFGLFEKVPEEDRDERLVYLMELRKFREQEPELYKKIANMPLRSRTGRKDKSRKDSTLAYLKDKNRDCFYYINPESIIEPLTFIEAAKVFDAKVTEKPYPLHEFHYDHVQVALGTFQEEVTKAIVQAHQVGAKLGPNEKKALAFINHFNHLDFVGDHEKVIIGLAKEAIRIGKFQKLPREVNKLLKSIQVEGGVKPADQLDRLLKILKTYPLMEVKEEEPEKPKSKKKPKKGLPEIIISESFIA
ncbi:MAG: helicase-related protein [Cyclobacteriaceae bacterium]